MVQDTGIPASVCLGACHSNPDAQYFLDSMVLKINEKKDSGVTYTEYELLDGQQRLTTMFLIFAVIRDFVDRKKYDQIIDVCRKAIFQEKNKYKSQPEGIRIVFDIREDVKEFVEKYVKTEGGTSDSKEKELEKKVGDKAENISIRNMAMVYSYYEAGRLIIDEKQNGNEGAAYGKYILRELSRQLTEELRRGFTFVGRQVRFTFEEEHYRVELVFFDRLLKCFVYLI